MSNLKNLFLKYILLVGFNIRFIIMFEEKCAMPCHNFNDVLGRSKYDNDDNNFITLFSIKC